MRFGPLDVAEAEGSFAAHSVSLGKGVLKKGTRIGPEEIERLKAAGIATIVAATLEPGDVPEDDAATRIATTVAGAAVEVAPAFTGRANLMARAAGIVRVDKSGIDRLNRVDPAITFATLADFAPVAAGQMVGTVKILPYAVASHALDAALEGTEPLLSVVPFRKLDVGLVQTRVAGTREQVLDKTIRVLDERLAPSGNRVGREIRTDHNAGAVAEAIDVLVGENHELVVVFGASANADRTDVVPTAIELAGGRVEQFGMPVDPGNLLVLGGVGPVTVVGAPGCARSPKENGFDWVLDRILADIAVTAEDITGMGVGGLLMEIATRPQPREESAPGTTARKVAAVVLAGGSSRRMGGPNKLVAELDGKPILAHVVAAALASRAGPVIVVTGNRDHEARTALAGLDVEFVYNAEHAEGLSTSLRAGIAAVPEDADAAIVLLGDMPRVSAATIDRLIEAFDPEAGRTIVVPTYRGKRGNPVLWARRYFPDLAAIRGDTGARHLIGENRDGVVEVEFDESVALDVDTPEALASLGGRFAD